MKNKKFNHLANTKMIVTLGLLIALSIAIGWLCKTYLTFGAIRLTFENVPIILSAIVYGPVIGAVVAVLSDIISCIMSPNPALNPIITLGAASIGIISGVISKYIIKNKLSLKVTLSVFLSHIIGSMIIKSIGLHVFWQYEFPVLFLRIPLYIAISICESVIIYLLLKNRHIVEMLENQTKRNQK